METDAIAIRCAPRKAGMLAPWVIFPLLLPWSIAGSYMTVALAFFMSSAGLSMTVTAGFLSAVLLPQTLKTAWAPLIDTTLGPKRWHMIGTVVTVATLIVLGFIPVTRSNIGLLTAFAVLSSVASTFVSLPNDVIMAYDVSESQKGQAAGWASASNLGGGAAGAGLAIYLSQQGLPVWVPAVALAALCAACGPFVLLAASRPPAGSAGNEIMGIGTVFIDLWTMVRSNKGALALFLLLLPIGTGAMANLLPALARDWRAGATSVLIVSGIGGCLVQIGGSLFGGWLCDRVDRKLTYCLAGVAVALVTAAMAFGPRTPLAFVGFSLSYLFVVGICYAAFIAVSLEGIGKGAAATKLMALVCVSNLSIMLVQFLDGVLRDVLDVTGMLLVETALGLASAGIFGAVLMVSIHRTRAKFGTLTPSAA